MWKMSRRRLSCGFALLLCASAAFSQSGTVRHHTVKAEQKSASSDLLDQAEDLLAKGDFASAEPLLQQATSKDPGSYQAWYDLGYTHQALNRREDAIADYRKSVAFNPTIFESNLNLGLALAASGQSDDALKFLNAAMDLKPASHPEQSKERAWFALGQLQEASDPSAAERSFNQALQLVPADPKPHLELGELYENQGKLELAKPQYQQALNTSQNDERARALRGLVNIGVELKQYDEVEKNVRDYLAAAPSDAQAHLLLGRLLASQGKNEAALTELNSAGLANEPGILQEKAQLLAALHRNSEAVPIYKQLVQQNGNSAQLRYQYALTLMQLHDFRAAEEQLLATLKLNPNLAAAYGDLAVVASENQQYDLTLKALDVRTKLLGPNPGGYFLRATALDHLRRYPEATESYRQFLAVANGKFPDQEWQARHRIIAIQKFK
jgi:tetratricopeptide (TPR) repeat protein